MIYFAVCILKGVPAILLEKYIMLTKCLALNGQMLPVYHIHITELFHYKRKEANKMSGSGYKVLQGIYCI